MTEPKTFKTIKTGSVLKYTAPVWERSYSDLRLTEWSLTILLEVKAANDAHIWLSASEDPKSKSKAKGYEIVMGANKNSKCFIRRGQQGAELTNRMEGLGEGPLKPNSSEKFWITYQRGIRNDKEEVRLCLGRGLVPGSHALLTAVDLKALNVYSVAVSTGFGSEGEWKLLSVKVSPVRTNEVKIVTPEEPDEVPVKRLNATPVKDSIVVKKSTSNASGLLKRPRVGLKPSPEKKAVEPSEEDRRIVGRSINRAIAKFA